jgi:predicted RNA-binding Zn ribbon-like protein
MTASSNAASFSLIGGHPVLDLVNTLDNRFREDGPTELLTDYGALIQFTEQSALLSAAEGRFLTEHVSQTDAQRALAAARELREAAAAALYASVEGSSPRPTDIKILTAHFETARAHQELVWKPAESKLAWEWKPYSLSDAGLPVWILALQTASLLSSDAVSRLRGCKSDTCRWLFLDTSKNHTRRWCDMKVCGNRMKARRFQARRT